MAATPSQNAAAIIKPMLDDVVHNINTNTKALLMASDDELRLAIEQLNTRMTMIEKLIGGQKKKIASKKLSDTAAAESNSNEPLADAKPKAPSSKFPNNSMLYFRAKYGKDKEFTARYETPELKKFLDEDATLKAIESETRRAMKTADAAWKFFKETPAHVTLVQEFKDAHAAWKLQQTVTETVEEATPPQ